MYAKELSSIKYTLIITASQPKSLNTLQPQDPVQTPQPAGPPITVASASPSQQPRRFHLSHALVAAGVVAASGFGSAVLVKVLLLAHIFMPFEYKIEYRISLFGFFVHYLLEICFYTFDLLLHNSFVECVHSSVESMDQESCG